MEQIRQGIVIFNKDLTKIEYANKSAFHLILSEALGLMSSCNTANEEIYERARETYTYDRKVLLQEIQKITLTQITYDG